jgi:hypothetical protein
MDRERFDKVWALAVNPGAIEGEALAAFRKMRELVKENPALGHPAPQTAPAPKPPQATLKARITRVHSEWVLILIGQLSKRAYELDLRNKITFDFSAAQTAIELVCEGSADACNEFERHVDWCIDYINRKLSER